MDKIEALQERFHRFFDLNKDGRATKKEVTNYLMKYDPTVSKSLVEEFIASRDLNKNGMIDFIPEYILAVSHPEVNSMKAREWFTLEDANNDNIITKDDIEKIGLRMGMSDEEIRDSMSYYALGDENGDGKITWSGSHLSLHRFEFSVPISRSFITNSNPSNLAGVTLQNLSQKQIQI
ncbi:uncharacterized protein LOC106881037 [Octopus bimaculoides]|nr:uncharacterized protein LOC106881037 [Octopus bimaculoides]|eukprot:XP_014786728.1 PREDICTED: calmodulin-like protein 12 [Octopus bimaculoides]